MIGLGRMGMNMAKRLLKHGHQVVAYNRSPEKTDQLVEEGAIGAYSLPEVVEKLTSPRIIWMMLPAGQAVDDHINKLKDLLSPDDIMVDGGNTYYAAARSSLQVSGACSAFSPAAPRSVRL